MNDEIRKARNEKLSRKEMKMRMRMRMRVRKELFARNLSLFYKEYCPADLVTSIYSCGYKTLWNSRIATLRLFR